MAQVTLDQAEKLSGEGGKFFKLKPDEFKTVRFLWDKWDDVSANMVHEISSSNSDGVRTFGTIDCPRVGGDPNTECKYCANGNVAVGRVIIPLYNLDDNKIQYWKRSTSWVAKDLKPVLDEVASLPSIANQTFKIKRTGSEMRDTKYTVTAVLNASDNRTKADFGVVDDPYKSGMIKKYGDESQSQGQQNAQGQNTSYQPRRTTDMF